MVAFDNCASYAVLGFASIFFIVIATIHMIFYYMALKERLLIRKEVYDDLAKAHVVMAIITLVYILVAPFVGNTVISDIVTVVVVVFGLACAMRWVSKFRKIEKDEKTFYRIEIKKT